MSKKWMSIPFAILCVLLLLFSCDNLGHIAPSSDAIPETNGIVSSAANIHYTEDALDLKPENILSWEAESAELILQDTSIPEAGQYVYTGISENFPYGALKKIVTVDSSALENSAEVRLITENAAITDIISEGTFTAKGNISIDGDAELLSPDGSIVFIEEDDSPLFVYNSEAELVRKFAISYDIADKASIRGTAKVELFLDFLLDIKWGKVETFSVSISPDVLFNISVTGVLDEEYRKYLGTLYFPPIVMGPVVLVPSIDLYLKTHFEGKIAWGGDFHATLDAGIRYSQNTWTPFADINADGSLNDLKMNGRTEAAFGPEVALKLYGLAGPYFALQGYVSANGTISTAKQSIDFEGTAGARGRLGGKLEILGKHFADLDFDLFDVHKGITLSSVFYETPAIQGSFSYPPIRITQGDSAQSAPVWANAPPDQKFTYSNSDSMPDGITLDPFSGIISVSSTALQIPERVFSISAIGTDGFSGIITGTLSISIAAPLIPAIQGSFSYPPIRITQGDSAQSAPVWANAPPDQKFTYSSGTPLPDGIKLDPLSGIISVSSTALQSPKQVFSISAVGIDGFSGIITGTLAISIAAPLIPAIQGSFSYPPISITQGDSAQSAPVWANAPPDQKFTYSSGTSLPDGIKLDPLSGIISVSSTALQIPEQVFSISAVGIDGFRGIITGTLSISIAAPPMPAIQGSFSYPPISITQGDSAKSAPVWANAPPDQKFTYSNGTPLPDGINLDPLSGIISVSSTALQSPEQIFSISAVGIDGFSGIITGTLSISIAAPLIPAIQGSFSYPSISITQGDSIQSAPVWANAPPDQKFTYSNGVSLPEGITLDPFSGIISVSSTALQSPEQVFSISAIGIDGFNGIITGTLSISIAAPPMPPEEEEHVPPDTPGELRSTGKTTASISLAWNSVAGTSAYELRRNNEVIYNGSGNSYTDSGLSKNTAYTYTVRAKNSADLYSDWSPSLHIISAKGPDLSISARIAEGASTVQLGNRIKIEFSVYNNGDMESDPTEVKYYSSDDSSIDADDDYLWSENLDSILPGNSRNAYLSIAPETRYYGAILESESGDFNTSNNASDGLLITAYLAVVGGLTETSTSSSSISMTWNPVTGASAYELRRDRNLIYSGSSTSYTDSGLSSAAEYSYDVRAMNLNDTPGSWSPIVNVWTDLAAPAAPGNLHATDVGSSSISMTWNPVPGASAYELRRDRNLVYSGSSTSYTDSGLSSAAEYSYDVRAMNVDDTPGNWSPTVNVWTDLAAPAAPGNLHATDVGSSSISMTWDPVPGASAYELRRDRNLVYRGSSSSYTDSGLSSAAEYSYDVRAINTAGSSNWSSELNVRSKIADYVSDSSDNAKEMSGSYSELTEYLHAGDEDWYKIYVPYRIWPYTLRVYTTGETDTKGSLYGVNLFGNRESTPRKTHDDIDYPENKNFSISEIVQIGGWFYIQVTGTNNNTSGYYRIVLSY